MENKTAQIHVRVDDDTRKQWLEVCETLKGNTQSKVFRKIIQKLYASIEEISKVRNYE